MSLPRAATGPAWPGRRIAPSWAGAGALALVLLVAAAIAAAVPSTGVVLLVASVLAAAWQFSTRSVATLLVLFVVVLLAVPANQVVAPLGSLGTPSFFLAGGLTAWWFASRVVPEFGFATGRQPVRTAVLVFLATACASYAAAMGRPLAAFEVAEADRMLLFLVAMGGLACAAADGITDRRQLDRVLGVLVAMGGAVALTGIVQYTVGFDIAEQIAVPGLDALGGSAGIRERIGLPRVSGTTQHPIEFGLVLAITLPLAIHYARFAPRPWARAGAGATVALIVVSAPMALARSGLIAALAALAVLAFAWSAAARIRLGVAGAAMVGLVALLFPGIVRGVTELFASAPEDPSVLNRAADIGPVLAIFSEHPVLGIGTGTFSPETWFIVDNQYLVTLMESGIVGLASLLGLLVTGAMTALGIRRRSAVEPTRHLAQALLAAVVVAALGMAALGFLVFSMISGATFLVLGAVGALWRLPETG